MKDYKIGDIIDETEFTDASLWCRENNATLTEIEPVIRDVEETYTVIVPVETETVVDEEEREETRIVQKEFRQFEIIEIPAPPPPTWEDIDRARIEYRQEHIDDKTIARMRKTANGTWTEEDEQEYLALDAEITAWIEENLPYPEE